LIVEARFIGVHATKDVIEISVRPTGELWTAGTGEEGIMAVTEKLSDLRPELVVMQASGSFELPIAGTLATAGLPFALVHPRQIREFAKAIGRMSKEDRRDAGLLAHFAELVRPEAWLMTDELVQQLRELKARRREIMQMLALERERTKGRPPIVQKDLQSHIFFLEKSLNGIDDQFNQTIRLSRIGRAG
jgi:transposase